MDGYGSEGGYINSAVNSLAVPSSSVDSAIGGAPLKSSSSVASDVEMLEMDPDIHN
jgi:hypothetical protein